MQVNICLSHVKDICVSVTLKGTGVHIMLLLAV